MTPQELQSSLTASPSPLLLHVLPEEVFAAARIPGSRNACVYEMTFVDQVRPLVPDPAAPIIVYGAGEGSLDAAAAAEKLREAGFTNVQPFDLGLAGWRAAGLPLEGDNHLPTVPAFPDGDFRLDPAQSIIRWTGRNLFNAHYGTVRCSGGHITLHHGAIVSARFTVDMTSIACDDLTDPAMNAMLIAHLQSADFFDTRNHPSAEFTASTADKISGCTEGTCNYTIHGTFTLRGHTRPLTFPVLIAPSADGSSLTAQGQFELDRTQFGSQYGSGKLFRFLGRHLVNDHIHLHVKIIASRA